jgi:hypothetical protein
MRPELPNLAGTIESGMELEEIERLATLQSRASDPSGHQTYYYPHS